MFGLVNPEYLIRKSLADAFYILKIEYNGAEFFQTKKYPSCLGTGNIINAVFIKFYHDLCFGPLSTDFLLFIPFSPNTSSQSLVTIPDFRSPIPLLFPHPSSRFPNP